MASPRRPRVARAGRWCRTRPRPSSGPDRASGATTPAPAARGRSTRNVTSRSRRAGRRPSRPMKLHRFDGPGKVRLDDIPADPPSSATKAKANDRLAELSDELFKLQDLMWGARTHSVLMVLQGRDAAGKDGTVKHLSGAFNPRGVAVTSFGVPSVEERQHDFLWRVHKHAPRAGEVAIFNRSHYEDVLVVRVKKLVPAPVWKQRYDLIRSFEQTLV